MKKFAVIIINKTTLNSGFRVIQAADYAAAENHVKQIYKDSNDYARVIPSNLVPELLRVLTEALN